MCGAFFVLPLLHTCRVHIRTREKIFLVSCRVATRRQWKRSMSANRALFACTSDGMVRKNLGNICRSDRVGVLAPYDTCGTAMLEYTCPHAGTCTCVHIHVSSCSAQPGQHEACMCECCPGCALQLLCCWKFLHV